MAEDVLFVDDDSAIVELFKRVLTREGYIVRTASNGNEALSKIAERIPDLVITDLNMPEMDGLALCGRLRENDQTALVPIILITGFASLENMYKSIKARVDDLIIKPFEIEQLGISVRNALTNKRRLARIASAQITTSIVSGSSMEERKHVSELIQIYQKRLRVLQKQEASFGNAAPPHIITEIEDINERISSLKQELNLHSALSEKDVPRDRSVSSHDESKPTLRRLRVFLCHSSRDKAFVRELYNKLAMDGFAPWLDEEDILPGQDWDLEISSAVQRSDVVIVCLSKDTISKSGYIQKELKYALSVAEQQPEGVTFIVPLKLEDVTVPRSLAKWQWVDFSSSEQQEYSRLIRALQAKAKDLGLLADP